MLSIQACKVIRSFLPLAEVSLILRTMRQPVPEHHPPYTRKEFQKERSAEAARERIPVSPQGKQPHDANGSKSPHTCEEKKYLRLDKGSEHFTQVTDRKKRENEYREFYNTEYMIKKEFSESLHIDSIPFLISRKSKHIPSIHFVQRLIHWHTGIWVGK